MSPRFIPEIKAFFMLFSSMLRLLLRRERRLAGTDELSEQPAVPGTSSPFANFQPLCYLSVWNFLCSPQQQCSVGFCQLGEFLIQPREIMLVAPRIRTCRAAIREFIINR